MSLNELEALKLEKLRREKQRRMSVQQPDIEQPQQQEESFGQMILGNLKEAGQSVYREGISPVLSNIDLAAFGIPKAITRKVGGQKLEEQIFPEQETFQGKAFRAAGAIPALFQGGAAQLARGGARILTPQLLGKVGLSIKAGEVAARSKAVLANKITRGAIEGSIFGMTQLTPDEEGEVSLGGQLGQGILGAGLGGAFPIAQRMGGRVATGVRKFQTPTRTRASEELITRIKEKQRLQKEVLKLSTQDKIRNIDDAIYSTRQEKKNILFEDRIQFQKSLKETTNRLRNNVIALGDALQSKSEEVAVEIQKKLPNFYRANSQAFGTKLDDISEGLASRGEDITTGEINAMLENISVEMDDALITEGRAREAILALKNKYAVDFISHPSSFFKMSTGTPAGGEITSNADQVIPLRQFYNDIKSIRKSLSSGAKSGATRYTQEDVAVSMFNKGVAEMLETRVPELSQLRQAYAPIIQSMKVSNRIFKPFKGEFETKTGSAMLKRFSLGKTEQGEELLVRSIEQGSDFAPGLGKITTPLKQKGIELVEARNRIQPMLDEMTSVNTLARNDIEKNFAEKVMKLKANQDFIAADSQIKEKMIENIVAARLKEIGVRDNVIDNLRKDKSKLYTVFRRLLYAGVALGGMSAARGGLRKIKGY